MKINVLIRLIACITIYNIVPLFAMTDDKKKATATPATSAIAAATAHATTAAATDDDNGNIAHIRIPGAKLSDGDQKFIDRGIAAGRISKIKKEELSVKDNDKIVIVRRSAGGLTYGTLIVTDYGIKIEFGIRETLSQRIPSRDFDTSEVYWIPMSSKKSKHTTDLDNKDQDNDDDDNPSTRKRLKKTGIDNVVVAKIIDTLVTEATANAPGNVDKDQTTT